MYIRTSITRVKCIIHGVNRLGHVLAMSGALSPTSLSLVAVLKIEMDVHAKGILAPGLRYKAGL